MDPSNAAASTIQGKARSNWLIATNANKAIPHSNLCFSTLNPIRYAANNTIATTAGLMPYSMAAICGKSP